MIIYRLFPFNNDCEKITKTSLGLIICLQMVLSLLQEFLKMLCCMHIHLKYAGMIIVCLGESAIVYDQCCCTCCILNSSQRADKG